MQTSPGKSYMNLFIIWYSVDCCTRKPRLTPTIYQSRMGSANCSILLLSSLGWNTTTTVPNDVSKMKPLNLQDEWGRCQHIGSRYIHTQHQPIYLVWPLTIIWDSTPYYNNNHFPSFLHHQKIKKNQLHCVWHGPPPQIYIFYLSIYLWPRQTQRRTRISLIFYTNL